MNVSKRSLSCILQENLHFGVYRRCVSHLLDARLKKNVTKGAKSSKKRATTSCLPMRKFSVSRRNSHQNDRVYAESCIRPKTTTCLL